MHQSIHYSSCPVCDSTVIKNVLFAKDYTVSGKQFVIVACDNCSLRFTQDVPAASAIAPYYKSDDYISHSNTSKGIVNRLYQLVRKKTLRQKRMLITQFTGKEQGRLLDTGSGTGAFVNEMTQQGWEVTGLEPDADARQLAKEIYQLELKDINQFYQLPPGSFDAITLWHVLEHVHDLSPYLEQIKKLLTAEGKLFVAVPNYTSSDAVVYKECWAAYDVPRHLYHFSPLSMQLLLEKHGLKIISHQPMWYDSFYISILSSKYQGGKTNYFTSFWNGLRSNFHALKDVKKCSSVIYVISK